MNGIEQNRIGYDTSNLYRDVTIGVVVDTNDPQQMGRVRVLCYSMGDDDQALMKDIPWATAISPLAGVGESANRGRGDKKTQGPVAYGMWNVPKVGSHVLVACVDGDTRFRVWLGCIHPQFMTHTLPHGRYVADGTDQIQGPLSSTEQPIEPRTTHQRRSFTPKIASEIVPEAPAPGSDYTSSIEYVSRGADYSVASVRDELVPMDDSGPVSVGDDNFEDTITESDGNTFTHQNGYKESRVVQGIGFESTDGKNYDPQIYSWTTPGFHTIAMDDSANNCRIRLRTTHGNQILLDDTNERIYISTPDGNTWLEMDEKGNIDIYASRNISYHAEKDINITAGDTVRIKAKNGVHIESDDEIRMHNKGEQGGDFHIRSETNIRQHSVLDTILESDNQISIKSGADILIQTGSILNITATSTLVSSPVVMNSTLAVVTSIQTAMINAADSAIAGPAESDGGLARGAGTAPSSAAAAPALLAAELQSYWTNRIPEHEPWARVMTKVDKTDMDIGNTHQDAAEFPYNSPDIGKKERGVSMSRNARWHR